MKRYQKGSVMLAMMVVMLAAVLWEGRMGMMGHAKSDGRAGHASETSRDQIESAPSSDQEHGSSSGTSSRGLEY